MKDLIHAWLMLIVASGLTTALAAAGISALWLGPLLLGLAFVKARVILSQYLDLKEAPRILSGMTLAVALWFVIVSALVLMA
jgi:hypothetical protein